jgi:hypothetical protein
VVFNASGSVDPDGVIISYMWDFGDDTQGTGVTPTHVYGSPGFYTVTLTVTDNTGLTSRVSQQVSVAAPGFTPGPQPGAVSAPSSMMILGMLGVLAVFGVLLVVFRGPLRALLSRRAPVSSPVVARASAAEVGGVEEILDALFQDLQQQAVPLSTDVLMEAYCDLIIENVEANPMVRLPSLSIVEVERIVDERYHAEICEKIDQL